MKVKYIWLFIVGLLLLTLLWLCLMIELTTLVSYEQFFTAGELFAWITANPYEISDIANYCVKYVSPYWIICTFIFSLAIFLFWKILKHQSIKEISIFLRVEIALLLPFVLLPMPSNLLREIHYVVKQIKNIKVHRFDSKDFVYNACQTERQYRQEIYVLAIGESIRYKNLSLNGEYKRETMPQLHKQSNFILYSDYYVNATLTQHALPMLLTGVAAKNFEEHFSRKTISTAFSEAGYRTALVSHRAQLMNNGYHDYLAKDFDTLLFVEHDSLIAPAVKSLAEKETKLFAVTHYLGNHMFYTNRTDDCLRWRPDYNEDRNIKSDSLFLNAYDNSLLYTDRLLNEAIETLERTEAVCAWLFISDHGEFISNKVSGHGHTYHPGKNEYHVPLMVWYNDKYENVYSQKVANMIRHKNEPVSADNIFWSVLDMAGIHLGTRSDRSSESEIRIWNEEFGMSIFGDTLLPYERTLLLPDGRTIMKL